MHRYKVVAVSLACAAVLAGCSGERSVQTLQVGDCFDDTAEMLELGEVRSVPSVPCDEPHDNEVFHVAIYSGDTYSAAQIEDFADEVCLAAFEPYVGRDYQSSVLEAAWFAPSEESWGQGDREVLCVLWRMDLQKLLQTVQNSAL